MSLIIQSVVTWNAQRYEQVYNAALTYNLLKEETDEGNTKDAVTLADSYADVIFVAIGALWKTGLTPGQIASFLDDTMLTYTEGSTLHETYPPLPILCAWFETVVDLAQTRRLLAYFVHAAYGSLATMGGQTFADNVVLAVCKSNGTKVVKRTDPTVKANIDKGTDYVPPTADITALVTQYVTGVQH